MAKPNYQFEKRQRDLAKKVKQEQKRLQKLAGKAVAETANEGDGGHPDAAASLGGSGVPPGAADMPGGG